MQRLTLNEVLVSRVHVRTVVPQFEMRLRLTRAVFLSRTSDDERRQTENNEPASAVHSEHGADQGAPGGGVSVRMQPSPNIDSGTRPQLVMPKQRLARDSERDRKNCGNHRESQIRIERPHVVQNILYGGRSGVR